MQMLGCMAFALATLSCFSLAASAKAWWPRHSVSGQSAGGSMAVNHLFAFSASVEGAGVAAGSPYGCGAQPDEEDRCYYGHVDIPSSIAYAYHRRQEGHIDDLANLKSTPVLLFNGKKDNEVYKRTMVDTFHQLQYFVDAKFLHTTFDTDAAHVWSLDHGQCGCGACSDFMDAPICCDVNNCFYDLSGDMLRKIYGPLRNRVQARPYLRRINQWKYVPRWEEDVNTTSPSAANETAAAPNRHGMWHWALAYIPSGCVGKVYECRIHVNYHGCIRTTLKRRRLWATSIDLNEYGEANNIVMLYPQAAGSEKLGEGCWNWGNAQVDPQFDTKMSYQMRTVMNMLADLENALEESELFYEESGVEAHMNVSQVPSIVV